MLFRSIGKSFIFLGISTFSTSLLAADFSPKLLVGTWEYKVSYAIDNQKITEVNRLTFNSDGSYEAVFNPALVKEPFKTQGKYQVTQLSSDTFELQAIANLKPYDDQPIDAIKGKFSFIDEKNMKAEDGSIITRIK